MRDSPANFLSFEPVPSASNRRDGWTPERQHAFIAALAKTGSVTGAAAAAGMSRKSAYALLERAGPESSFALAWRAAYEAVREARRAAAPPPLFGEIPYFYGGLQRGTRPAMDDRRLLRVLRALDRMEAAAQRKERQKANGPLNSPQLSGYVGELSSPSSPSRRGGARGGFEIRPAGEFVSPGARRRR